MEFFLCLIHLFIGTVHYLLIGDILRLIGRISCGDAQDKVFAVGKLFETGAFTIEHGYVFTELFAERIKRLGIGIVQQCDKLVTAHTVDLIVD